MKSASLSQKLLWACGFIFILFLVCSTYVFYRGQTRLTEQEMDRLLQSEALTLSSLVNLDRRGGIDFEFSRQFVSLYETLKFTSFFRYYTLDAQTLLKASSESPNIDCDLSQPFRFVKSGSSNYRVFSYRFVVDVEVGESLPAGTKTPELCLLIGNDAAPYQGLVNNTIRSSVPFLIGLLVFSLLLFQYIVRRLTRDLSLLTKSLSASDFSSTLSFPTLSQPSTIEVKSIVEKLTEMHNEATAVYEEMLLFMARAAHQLKTPVTAIQATLEVLVRKERTMAELMEGISDLQIGVRQMSQLTQKLISSSRVTFESKPILKLIDFVPFLETQWKLFHFQAKAKGISCYRDGASACLVLADAYLLTEIFGNLLENAIIYSPPHSRIQVSWRRQADAITVLIKDEGFGFSEELKAHLFEPFYRGDERLAGGSGLGLSIVKRAVTSLGGTVHLAETSAQGSILCVTLRAAEAVR